MSVYLISITLLRIVHIVAGVCWVGGNIIQAAFLEPTARATAPESGRFMEYLMFRRRFGMFMSVSAILTIVAGALLYWYRSGGQIGVWMMTGSGLTFTIGSVFGLVAAAIGFLVMMPTARQLGQIGQTIQGAPTAGQMAEMNQLRARMSQAGRIEVIIGVLALALMAAARYIV